MTVVLRFKMLRDVVVEHNLFGTFVYEIQIYLALQWRFLYFFKFLLKIIYLFVCLFLFKFYWGR